jgi:DNA-directed RNA polymerase specialized sigma24 family protein
LTRDDRSGTLVGMDEKAARAAKQAKALHDRAVKARTNASELTAERNAALLVAYEEGATIPELADMLGVSGEIVSRAVGRPRNTSGRRNMRESRA